jgi:hypothetical protein
MKIISKSMILTVILISAINGIYVSPARGRVSPFKIEMGKEVSLVQLII